jgi:hypothetical protein
VRVLGSRSQLFQPPTLTLQFLFERSESRFAILCGGVPIVGTTFALAKFCVEPREVRITRAAQSERLLNELRGRDDVDRRRGRWCTYRGLEILFRGPIQRRRVAGLDDV